jgi:hypothetical protein
VGHIAHYARVKYDHSVGDDGQLVARAGLVREFLGQARIRAHVGSLQAEAELDSSGALGWTWDWTRRVQNPPAAAKTGRFLLRDLDRGKSLMVILVWVK